MLQNAYLIAPQKIGFDTAENQSFKIWQTFAKICQSSLPKNERLLLDQPTARKPLVWSSRRPRSSKGGPADDPQHHAVAVAHFCCWIQLETANAVRSSRFCGGGNFDKSERDASASTFSESWDEEIRNCWRHSAAEPSMKRAVRIQINSVTLSRKGPRKVREEAA